jgi:hypothetical protein
MQKGGKRNNTDELTQVSDSSYFEKQIVLRASLLKWIRKLRLRRSIRWVYFLLITWLVEASNVRYTGQASVM